MHLLLFSFGLVLLACGGDILVKGAVSLAKKLHLSPLLIGIVLIGFGTSTPELVASMLAVFQTPPSPGIAVGNVIGSNIANIFLVLGLAAVIRPVKIQKESFTRDSLFLFISALALTLAAWIKTINFFAGLILVSLLFLYVWYSYFTEKKSLKKKSAENLKKYSIYSILRSLLVTAFGIGLTMYGAHLLVENAIIIARNWGISETIIGLTLVAVGTSLPELATSVIASLRHQNDVAFGNVVGSNIYNALFILGVVALFVPIHIPADIWSSLFFMLGATFLLIFTGIFHQVSRKMGCFYLLCYGGYILWLVQSS